MQTQISNLTCPIQFRSISLIYFMKIFLDTDSEHNSHSDTDSTTHDFDLSNQTLNDY